VKKTLLILILLSFFIVRVETANWQNRTVQVQAANWQNVTTFSGSSQGNTDYFTCTHVEWRIVWSFVPDPNYPEFATLQVATVDIGGTVVGAVFRSSGGTTSGIAVLYNQEGTFCLDIETSSIQSYVVTVQEDTASPIPEYPTFITLIGILVLIGTIIIKTKHKT
jgi:hypothetical protein